MFDTGLCSGMKKEGLAYVNKGALLLLRELVTPSTDCVEKRVIEAQHFSSNSGGADADNIPIQGPPGRVVCMRIDLAPVKRIP
jgi:hypothetical protein